MSVIKSARFVQPHSRHSVVIEMQVDHEGAAAEYVSCRANTQTYALREFAGVKDGPLGDDLINYLNAAVRGSGRLRSAIDSARSMGF
ncbi:hypothetical protein [Bradyrhizobium prioriisuperbiae]|uniref:hypothetical protein n=1 Tax=Bradyrhizobium prioriisuperbiae TaxID=2854389 RepID=UPI0028F14F2D|nr:hypothetical protein [Bradyrhizobium prioritasuperba]